MIKRFEFDNYARRAGQQDSHRWGGMKQSSPKVAPWRAAVAFACEKQFDGEPITDPVEMQITFLLPRAKHHWSKAKGKENELLPERYFIAARTIWTNSPAQPLTVAMSAVVAASLPMTAVVSLALAKRYAERLEPTGAVDSFEDCPLINILSASKAGPILDPIRTHGGHSCLGAISMNKGKGRTDMNAEDKGLGQTIEAWFLANDWAPQTFPEQWAKARWRQEGASRLSDLFP